MGLAEIAFAVAILLIGIGVAIALVGSAVTQGEVTAARACFIGAAILLALFEGGTLLFDEKPLAWRITTGLVVGAFVFVGLPEGLRWINRRQSLAPATLGKAAEAHIASTEQHGRAEGLKSQAVQAVSRLGVVLEGANIFAPTRDLTKTGVALYAKIWNAGEPVFITDWQLKVSPDGEAQILAPPSVMPEKLTLRGSPNIVLERGSSLSAKFAAEKVTEKPADGVLLFYVDAPLSKVKSANTVFELTIRDSQNRKTVFTKHARDWLRLESAK